MSKNIIIAFAVIVVLTAGTVYYFKDKADHEAAKKQQRAYQQELMALEQRAIDLKNQVKALEEEIDAQDPEVDEVKMVEVFGEGPVKLEVETMEVSPEEAPGEVIELEPPIVNQPMVDDKVQKFFSYIDERGYITARGVSDNASCFFENVIGKLQRARPVIVEETKDMYTLLKNITYFFRVLGKTDVLIIKDILKNEADIMEPTMALFYDWLNPWGPEGRSGSIDIAPELAYEYTGFFLQTIAGQAYIFRRDSKVRTLTTYYCILALDNANLEGLNRNGIDIRPHIDTLIQDLGTQRTLADRRKYLEVLRNLRKKYSS